jgi:hypothetical protein
MSRVCRCRSVLQQFGLDLVTSGPICRVPIMATSPSDHSNSDPPRKPLSFTAITISGTPVKYVCFAVTRSPTPRILQNTFPACPRLAAPRRTGAFSLVAPHVPGEQRRVILDHSVFGSEHHRLLSSRHAVSTGWSHTRAPRSRSLGHCGKFTGSAPRLGRAEHREPKRRKVTDKKFCNYKKNAHDAGAPIVCGVERRSVRYRRCSLVPRRPRR